jgi:hypothetical protein
LVGIELSVGGGKVVKVVVTLVVSERLWERKADQVGIERPERVLRILPLAAMK